MKPIIPFEPIRAEEIPSDGEWIAQIKWDGVRVLTYYDGAAVKLYNRKQRERTYQFPELLDVKRYSRAESFILDGEIIALENGKPSFNAVMKRDGVTNLQNVEKARNSTPISYMIFDILFYNDNWVYHKTLKERQHILNSIITPQQDLQLVQNFDDAKGLLEVIKKEEMEGIVCKNLKSTYVLGGKDRRWQKIKNYRDVIAVVGGFTLRGNTINALLLGLYNQRKELLYIGHTGTGKLSHRGWQELTDRLNPLTTQECPFKDKTQKRINTFWVKPQITAKIKFTEWTPGGSLRQPSIQSFTNIPADECIFE